MKITPTSIASRGRQLIGQFFEPRTGFPGVLFVHGWAGSQKRDERRSRAISQLGCICLTFDMSGHGEMRHELESVTPAENLTDVCAAYDALAAHADVDASSIAVVASSYGAYLAAFLCAERKVRWLALRVPALYRDEDWQKPKFELKREDMQEYRRRQIPVRGNSALRMCEKFAGDVLIVESEIDDFVPRPTIASYVASFSKARSLTHRVIEGADHGLTSKESQRAYDELLLSWISEMVFGAR